MWCLYTLRILFLFGSGLNHLLILSRISSCGDPHSWLINSLGIVAPPFLTHPPFNFISPIFLDHKIWKLNYFLEIQPKIVMKGNPLLGCHQVVSKQRVGLNCSSLFSSFFLIQTLGEAPALSMVYLIYQRNFLMDPEYVKYLHE